MKKAGGDLEGLRARKIPLGGVRETLQDGNPKNFRRSSRLSRVTYNHISLFKRDKSLQRGRQRRDLGHPRPPPLSLEQARRRGDEDGKVPKVPGELENQLPEAPRGTGHGSRSTIPPRYQGHLRGIGPTTVPSPKGQNRGDRQPGPRALKETRGCL